jgi:hypothetical protein
MILKRKPGPHGRAFFVENRASRFFLRSSRRIAASRDSFTSAICSSGRLANLAERKEDPIDIRMLRPPTGVAALLRFHFSREASFMPAAATKKETAPAPTSSGADKQNPWRLEKILQEELIRLRPEAGKGGDAVEELLRPPVSPSIFASIICKLVGDPDRTVAEQPDSSFVSPKLADKLFQQNFSALCLSGGGIRSASFCLGFLQALAERRFLSGFDYLSTVSGGGYIGSWLSAWRYREGQDIASVEQSLSGAREPKEVSDLRDFTSYLTPRRGLMSSDTWAGVATIARNLILNWTLFLPIIFLAVWIPKATVLTLSLGRNWLVVDDGAMTLGPGSPAFWLLTCAASLYAFTEVFTSQQLIIQEQQGGRWRPPFPYGAGQTLFVIFGLIPVYVAACLASIVLIRAPAEFQSWSVLIAFAGAGALLWGLPFLLASKMRLDWLLAARSLAGAGFGVALALFFFLLNRLELDQNDRYVVILGVAVFFLAHLIGGVLFVGLSSRIFDHDAVREWTARASGWFLVSGLVWTIYATLVLWDPGQDWPGNIVVSQFEAMPRNAFDAAMASLGGVAGVGAALFGQSNNTSASEEQKSGRLKNLNWTRVAVAAAVFFFAVLFFELSRVFDWIVLSDSLAHLSAEHLLTGRVWPIVIYAPAILLLWAMAASYFVNINKFSLHAFYRNRLIRAYLGASNRERRPSAFTGFDEGDNPKMRQLPQDKPIHIVNIALNLVHGQRLAWQERKASSFTVSPLAAGNPQIGYRSVERYGEQISLGTAMAISGAAVSPNMGYHSSPMLALLMTLFNARLGWWLGNPSKGAWDQAGPLQSVLPFIMEVFGLTDEKQRFVYLSDGGHFENIGVYEMLRRRCRTIVAIDAGCDPNLKFEDLGNAIRKARIDFGVEIEFDAPRAPPGSVAMRLGLANRPKVPCCSPYCSIARIHYPEIPEAGALIYIKAAIHGNEPQDVLSYAAANPTFPHESTADQFFSESQFESYRRLGLHIGSTIFAKQREGGCAAAELVRLAQEHVESYLIEGPREMAAAAQ